MQGHMRKHLTEKHTSKVKFEEDNSVMSIDEFINEHFGDLPQWAVALRGLRNREGLTQVALGKILETPQTNISKMEMGKRSIGKNMAKKLASFFKTDYHIFL